MAKEGAEKATTESDNSVTSKEDDSLADNNGNKNSGEDETKLNPLNAEEPSEAIVSNDEDLPAKGQSEEKSKILPEVIVESESAHESTNDEIDKPDVTPADEKAQQDSETSKSEDIVVPEKQIVEISDSDMIPVSEKPKESATEENSNKNTKQAEKAGSSKVSVENNKPDATDQTRKPEPKEAPKEKGKKTTKKESAIPVNVIEGSPAGAEHHEEPQEEHHKDYQKVDFTTYSKEELVEVIKNLGKYENPFSADRILKIIAPLFNQKRALEREETLKRFIAEGGVEDDFQYKPDELSLRFDANYKLIKDKKTKRFKEQDIERSKNLILAEEVLNELRDFVDSEESSGSFKSFKVIQQKWKDIGDVPSQNSRTLWANYNALIHRFYDQRSIYFELKELDRKKNYESKLILCDKAESLVDVKNLREAIKSLNDLHHEFKHLGPVPLDVQEELWQRFKAASDKVYERRKVFVHELKAELHENLVKKQELIEEIKLFIEFNSDRIKEWNEKTKELIKLQNSWEAIGGLPKDKAKQLNKEFWSLFKKFFSNKHLFFKKLDADRDEHLIKKQALLEQAKTLKDSEDWDKTANELKSLQSQWREIGPVPEKMRKKLYEEFKACCDHFFEKRRVGVKNSNEDFKVNLKEKKKVIADIIKLKKDADKNLDKFNELREEFLKQGYVPKKNITSIKEEYQNAVESYLNDVTILNVKQKTEISLEAEFASLAGSEHSETELYHKEQSVRRQINKLEDDIALWQNNLEFFAQSKSTDKLREEVNKKIDDATVHVESLKRQLKMLRTL